MYLVYYLFLNFSNFLSRLTRISLKEDGVYEANGPVFKFAVGELSTAPGIHTNIKKVMKQIYSVC